ncbi:MAG: C2H2-type zinc finger protein [Planctomycetes bacterium]|nr:C2H2-type zinc finger protein [Planctomycetota bacterium]
MAKRKLKCPKCDRTFSMAAHLARHTSAAHATGARKALPEFRLTGGISKTGRRPGRPKGRITAGLGRRLTLGEGPVQLVSGLQAYYNTLMSKQQELDAEIAALNTAIAAMSGIGATAMSRPKKAPAKSGRHGMREGSLKSYIVKVLGERSTAMSPSDIAARIKQAGYESKAKDLTKAVSNALPGLPGVKKEGFGMYRGR